MTDATATAAEPPGVLAGLLATMTDDELRHLEKLAKRVRKAARSERTRRAAHAAIKRHFGGEP